MAHLNFPPPTDDAAFERLVEELAAPALKGISSSLYGRKGQGQQGVDVVVELGDGSFVGIQCKSTIHNLSIAVVTAEIDKAKKFSPKLSRFIVATTTPRDAVLQQEVRKLRSPGFSVEVWSWNDINDQLNRNAGVGLSYIRHVLLGDLHDAEQAHAEAVRQALERPAFLRTALAEHSFSDQLDAVRDTMAFLRLGYLYTRDGTFVTGHAPYRTYDEGYVKRIDSIVRALDSMDTFLHRKRAILDDMNAPDHESALIELDSKRIAVLKAGNRLFAAKGIPRIHVGR
ncbi:hypothetical protein F0U59_18475 [Archangium gephyra]|nr:hypothetical protein F0U59_18475 [Archangium gephyra]